MDFLEELDIDFTMPTIDFTEDWADVDFNMTDEEVSKLFDLTEVSKLFFSDEDMPDLLISDEEVSKLFDLTDENFNGLFADEA